MSVQMIGLDNEKNVIQVHRGNTAEQLAGAASCCPDC